MSLNFEKLDVEVPDGPGIYSLPFPLVNPTGNIVVLVAKNNQICLTYVTQPIQIFEDSAAAFADVSPEGPIVDSIATETNQNIIQFNRKLNKTVI